MCKKDVIKILVGSLNQAGMKVADYLKKQGYNVAQSDYNPLEIQLEVLKSKPDFLIISEITEFPYELCKNLKGACPKLKIIMLSNRKTNNGNNGLAKELTLLDVHEGGEKSTPTFSAACTQAPSSANSRLSMGMTR